MQQLGAHLHLGAAGGGNLVEGRGGHRPAGVQRHTHRLRHDVVLHQLQTQKGWGTGGSSWLDVGFQVSRPTGGGSTTPSLCSACQRLPNKSVSQGLMQPREQLRLKVHTFQANSRSPHHPQLTFFRFFSFFRAARLQAGGLLTADTPRLPQSPNSVANAPSAHSSGAGANIEGLA